MRKICHIRCNDKYWEKLNVYSDWKKAKKRYIYFTKIIELWNKHLKIDYLSFRKQIRDLVINYITNKNIFDILLHNNQDCEKYFRDNNSENTILYQQDDDDIFLDLPPINELEDGVNIFSYSFIDPIGGRRKKGYKNRQFGLNEPVKRVQSNHSIIFNKTKTINVLKHELYKADHTYYDKLINNYNYKIFNYPISIQVYHLHSLSLWKNQYHNFLHVDNCKYNFTESSKFLNKTESFITEINNMYINNKNIPILKEMVGLYNKLT